MKVQRIVVLIIMLLLTSTLLRAQPFAKNGVLDVSDFDLKNNTILLSGQWNFYPKALLSPQDVANTPPPEHITVPNMWNYEKAKDSTTYPGRFYGTYHLKVVGVKTDAPLVFDFNKIYTSCKIFINGKLICEHGKIGTSKEEAVPNFYPEMIPVQAINDTIDVVLQVSNFHHREGGIFETLKFGVYKNVAAERDYHLIFDMLLFGAILIMALYHLALYFLRRRSVSALYFGIFAAIVALRTILTGSEALAVIYPNIPWGITYRVEYFTFFVGVSTCILFARSIFTRFSKWFTYTVVVMSILFTTAVLVLPTYYHAFLLMPYQLMTVLAIVLVLISVVRAGIRKEESAWLFLVALFALFGTVINDILHAMGHIRSIELAPFGLFIFIFAQAYMLAKRFNAAFIQNESLTETLDYQNKNLEQIVKQRTAEIAQQKEEILAQSELLLDINASLEKLSIVADKTDNAVVIADKDGKIEWINGGFYRLYGYNLREFTQIYGDNLVKVSSNDEVSEMLKQVYEDKHSVQYEFAMTSKSGKKIWVQTTVTPILDENSNVSKLVAIDSDVSPLKQAQAEIMQRNEEIMTQKEALQQKTEEILAQRDELEMINKKLDIHNQNIQAGIRYALNIQKAILPDVAAIRDVFPNAFAIYKPKDIVSGDFYWFVKANVGNCHFLAVVDCTGHGVPGAFMSMIGTRLLSSIVTERNITDPSEILENLDAAIIKALRQKSSEYNDGMDVCLIKHEQNADGSHKIQFSGAKRPLYVIKSGTKQLQRIGGTRRGIGGTNIRTEKHNFEVTELQLNTGDAFYLTSDGIIDQNNTERTRFGSARFEELITSVSMFDVAEQEQIILDIFNRWKEREEQRDDITMIGVKL